MVNPELLILLAYIVGALYGLTNLARLNPPRKPTQREADHD